MTVTQTDFRTALMDPDLTVPAGLTDGHGYPAGRRFSVYRNNVAVSLTEALETGFPVIAKLLGEQNFKTVVSVFLRQSPPVSPLMMHYGAGFPEFLDGFEPLSHLGYLADVARLELGLRRAYHAADAEPVDPQILAAVPPEQLSQICMTFVPAVELVRSPWPVHAVWKFNTEENAPKPQAVAQDVLITRPDFDPFPRLLPPGGANFVATMMDGATLGEALENAMSVSEGFDLSSVLALLLQDQAIAHLKLEETE